MDAVFIVVLLLVFLPIVLILALHAQARWKEALQQVARQLGIRFEAGGWLTGSKAVGDVDGFELCIDSYTVRRGKSSTTYTRIRVGSSHFGDLVFEPEGVGASLKKVFVGEDAATGDRKFDASVVARGTALEGLLGPEARAAVYSAVVDRRIRLKDGRIEFLRAGLIKDPDGLVTIARDCLKMAAALRDELRLGVVARLEQRVTSDPVRAVRLRALQLLLAGHSRTAEAARAVEAALASDDPTLRLTAARVAGPAGFPAVIAVLRERLTEDVVMALDVLVEVFSKEAAVPEVLDELLARAQTSPVLLAALHACRAVGHRPAQSLLLPLLGGSESRVQQAAADLLGDHATPEAESALIGLLEKEDTALRTVIAASLGRMGTAAAVAPLLEYTKGLFVDGDLKSAARAAIASIQQRLGDVEAGGLTLVDDGGAGGLSMADAAPQTDAVEHQTADERGRTS